jgi:hypothetical protein
VGIREPQVGIKLRTKRVWLFFVETGQTILLGVTSSEITPLKSLASPIILHFTGGDILREGLNAVNMATPNINCNKSETNTWRPSGVTGRILQVKQTVSPAVSFRPIKWLCFWRKLTLCMRVHFDKELQA